MNCFTIMIANNIKAILANYIIFWLIELSYSSNEDASFFVRVRDFDGYLHSTYKLTNLTAVKSRIACASVCMKTPTCDSFFYLDTPQNLCQAHSAAFITTNEAVKTPSASYYQLTPARCPLERGFILHRPIPLCYRYFQSAAPMGKAKQSCLDIQSHLIDVKTPDISTFIVNYLKSSAATRAMDVWTGGNLASGTWYWSDGSRAIWTNFYPGEPNNLSVEKCLTLRSPYGFKWNNDACGTSRAYICQVDI